MQHGVANVPFSALPVGMGTSILVYKYSNSEDNLKHRLVEPWNVTVSCEQSQTPFGFR